MRFACRWSLRKSVDEAPWFDAKLLAVNYELREVDRGAGAICHSILASLPTWLGIPSAVDDYVTMADTHGSLIAAVDGLDIGITTLVHHSPDAAEVHLMAVMPTHHRRGVGRAMLGRLEVALAHQRVAFLQVKTLSSADPDAGYAETRAFYRAYGFRVLEEFPLLWGPDNPAVQMIKVVDGRG